MAESLFRDGGEAPRVPGPPQEVQKLKKYLGASGARGDRPDPRSRSGARSTSRSSSWGVSSTAGAGPATKRASFKRIYGTRSDESLALIFGRSEQAIKRHAESLHLAKDKAFLRKVKGSGTTRMPRWSEQELELLKPALPDHAQPRRSRSELNRSVKSVVSKAHHMGLKKDIERLREMGRQNVSLRYRKGK